MEEQKGSSSLLEVQKRKEQPIREQNQQTGGKLVGAMISQHKCEGLAYQYDQRVDDWKEALLIGCHGEEANATPTLGEEGEVECGLHLVQRDSAVQEEHLLDQHAGEGSSDQ